MPYAGEPAENARVDTRLLILQAERVARTIRATLASSPIWAAVVAFIVSKEVPFLGSVPFARSAMFCAIVLVAIGTAYWSLRIYDASAKRGMTPTDAAYWLKKFLGIAALLSMTWGLAPWLLWDDADPINHVFVALVCLAVVARFVVHRSNHLRFFLGSFLPLTLLLVARLMLEFQPMEMTLAALVPLYAIQVVTDSAHISRRWDEEALLRFSYEDITGEMKRARDNAVEERVEAEVANASKTAFLTNMSHELRTPLNAILGFSDIIAHEYLGPVGSPRYREYAIDIHNSGSHLLSLINGLLDVAKIEAGRMEIEPQMVDTRHALDTALKFVGAKARERRQTLNISVEPGAEFLYADERALKQIVINLASNSVKFTPEGGRIEVSARTGAGGDFELCVVDNGPGIPKEKLDRIFKPFARLDNRYDSEIGGTGLGLALVKGLAELHGGRTWIESEEGEGTSVYVAIPMRNAPETERLRA